MNNSNNNTTNQPPPNWRHRQPSQEDGEIEEGEQQLPVVHNAVPPLAQQQPPPLPFAGRAPFRGGRGGGWRGRGGRGFRGRGGFAPRHNSFGGLPPNNPNGPPHHAQRSNSFSGFPARGGGPPFRGGRGGGLGFHHHGGPPPQANIPPPQQLHHNTSYASLDHSNEYGGNDYSVGGDYSETAPPPHDTGGDPSDNHPPPPYHGNGPGFPPYRGGRGGGSGRGNFHQHHGPPQPPQAPPVVPNLPPYQHQSQQQPPPAEGGPPPPPPPMHDTSPYRGGHGGFRSPRGRGFVGGRGPPHLGSRQSSMGALPGRGRPPLPEPISRHESEPVKSPRGSPQHRKPVLKFFQQEPREEETTAEDDALLTTELGNDIDRVEAIVETLADVLNHASLKKTGDAAQSKLPSKDVILRAVAKMDFKIRHAQKTVEDKQEELAALEKQLEEERVKRKKAQDEENRRSAELKAQREAETRQRRQEQVVKLVEERLASHKAELDAEEETRAMELDERIAQAVEEEKATIELEIADQSKALQEKFDRDIAKAKRDLEKARETVARTQAKVVAAEEALQSSMDVDATENTDESMGDNDMERIYGDNRRKAAEAQAASFAMLPNASPAKSSDGRDEKFKKWSIKMQQVTGFANALYTEPSEAPFYEQTEATHAVVEPVVREYVAHKKKMLTKHWTELAEEYEYRQSLYKAKSGASDSPIVKKSVVPRFTQTEPILESTRASTNPYRRPRRGNEARSEYEQEQIIAELAAKEKMEKKIASGGCDLPRQVGLWERHYNTQFYNTFRAQRVNPIQVEEDNEFVNVWSDMEKCIFLDRFMHFPKDFKKIAAYLRNKSCRECVQFYYDSKQYIPYKQALREHNARRKRQSTGWEATLQAAISCGATVKCGESEDKPLIFLLPGDDHTYISRLLHPQKRELFDCLDVDVLSASVDADLTRSPRRGKRNHESLFVLDEKERKFLKPDDSYLAKSDDELQPSRSSTPPRRVGQKWTAAEKKLFTETLEKHGRNWQVLAEAVGTKTISQIKNYYYDYKKQEKQAKGLVRDSRKSSRSNLAQGTAAVEGPGGVLGSPSHEALAAQMLTQQQLGLDLSQNQQLLALQERLRMARGSGSSTPDILQHQDLFALLNHHQQQQQSSVNDEILRQLLHPGAQAQSHQILSQLLPWQQQQATANAGGSDWEAQQLQHAIQMHLQQQQFNQQRQHHQDIMSSLGNPQLHALAGSSNLAGVNPSYSGGAPRQSEYEILRLLEQRQAQQQQAQQQQTPNGSDDITSLLARALSRGNNHGNFQGGY